jgi:hypothetical protein
MNEPDLRNLLAGVVALLVATSSHAQGARPMNLVWAGGGLPDPNAKYLLCGAPESSGADYCVAEGTWVGLCSKESDRANPHLFVGALTVAQGTPRIPGCEERIWLLWKAEGQPAAEYQKPGKVTLGGDTRGPAASFDYSGRTHAVAVARKTLRLEVKVDDGKGAKTARTADLGSHFKGMLPPSEALSLDVVGDVTGDGAPELIVTTKRDGFTKHYQSKSLVPFAVMVTLSEAPRVVGWTHGMPWNLYTQRDCKRAGVACDVLDYLQAKESCDHFAGEEPYDEERAAFLREKLQGCDKLEARRDRLLRKHQGNKAIQAALSEQME